MDMLIFMCLDIYIIFYIYINIGLLLHIHVYCIFSIFTISIADFANYTN